MILFSILLISLKIEIGAFFKGFPVRIVFTNMAKKAAQRICQCISSACKMQRIYVQQNSNFVPIG